MNDNDPDKMIEQQSNKIDAQRDLFKEAKNDSGARLLQYIQKIEGVKDEIAELQLDIKDVFTEIKNAGYEPSIVRQIIRLRQIDSQKRREQTELLDLYSHAIGLE